MAILDEFVIELLFDTQKTKSSATETQQIISGLVTKAISALALIGSFDFAKGIIDQFTEVASSTAFFAQSVNESVESIGEWQQAVIRTGGSADSFNQSLQSLYKSINELSLTNQGATGGVLYYLGINAKDANGHLKSTTDVLLQLSKRFENLDTGRRNYLGEKLGLDPATIRLLGEGQDKVKQLLATVKQYGVITQQQAKEAIAYKTIQANLTQSYDNLRYQIAETLLPVFTKLSNSLLGISQWFRQNSDDVKAGIIGIGSAITLFLLPSIIRLGVATIPLLPMVALITSIGAAIALVAQDVVIWKNGGHSAFGQYYADIEKVYNAIERFYNHHKKLIDGLGALALQVGATSLVLKGFFELFTPKKKNAIQLVGDALKDVGSGVDVVKDAGIALEVANPFGWVILTITAFTVLITHLQTVAGWLDKLTGKGTVIGNARDKALANIKKNGISLYNATDNNYFSSSSYPILANPNITPQALGATQAISKAVNNQQNTSHMSSIGNINININVPNGLTTRDQAQYIGNHIANNLTGLVASKDGVLVK